MARTIPLSKPLKTHDGEVMELKLRDLEARDIVKMRDAPFKIIQRGGEGVELEVRYDIMMAYISMLTGMDDIVLGSLSGKDFQKACAIMGEVWNEVGE